MNVRAIRTKIFKEGDNLFEFIKKSIPKLKDCAILVVTSKIVALAEGRVASVNDKEKIIKSESDWALRSKYGKITHKQGMLMWNAGTDESNARGKLVLLPNDSFSSARSLRRKLRMHYKIKKLGVVISDSRIMPLRAGVAGVALGYAGFKGLRDYRGMADIFGRTLKFTQTDVADDLATAAVLVMGEGNERQPLALIEDAPVEFTERVNRKELLIPFDEDMYRPLFRTIRKSERRKK